MDSCCLGYIDLGLCEILCSSASERNINVPFCDTQFWLYVQVIKIGKLLKQPDSYSLISQIVFGEWQSGTEIEDTYLCNWK